MRLGCGLILFASAAFADDAVVARGPLAAQDGVSVSGVVRAPTTGPVLVTLMRRAMSSPRGWTWGPSLVVSAKDGQAFRFEGLAPGDFDLSVAADGLASSGAVEVRAYRDVGGVEARGGERVEARLEGECSIRVRVKLEFAGKVDEARITLCKDDREVAGNRAKNGVFEASHVAPGRYWIVGRHGDDFDLTARREGSLAVDLKPGANEFELTIPETPDVRLVVEADAPQSDVEGVLRCRGLPSWQVEEPFRLSFRCVDEVSATYIAGMRSAGFGLHWGSAGPDVSVRGFSNGTFTPTIEALGFEPWEKRVEISGPTTIRAELKRKPGRFLALRDKVDERRDAVYVDARPAAGGPWKQILVEDRRDEPSDVGDWLANRAFLEPGTWLVSATTPQLCPSPPQTIVVAADDRSSTKLAFENAPGRMLVAKTKSRAGVAVDGFIVHVLMKDGDAWRALEAKSCVAANGGFEIRGLPRGSYRFAFDEAGAFPFGAIEIAGADVLDAAFVVCGKE